MKPGSPSFSARAAASLAVAASFLAIAAVPAHAATYVCTPDRVATFSNRVHVRCTAATPAGILWFAVCSDGNSAFAARALSTFTAAKVTGKNLVLFYELADTSGTACGCLAGDCRVIWGAELQP